MFKYMKYELRGTYKFISTLLIFVLGASTGLQLTGLKNIERYSNGQISPVPVFVIVILALTVFGSFVTAFFYIISSFRKELYEDRGYLTFSLPLTGKQVLGSKLLTALIWGTVLLVSSILYNIILGIILFGDVFSEGLKLVYDFSINSPGFTSFILAMILVSIVSGISTLLLMYFSITLSKVSISNKKLGGLWFIFFLVLNSITSYFTLIASKLVPYYLNVNTFSILNAKNIISDLGNPTAYFMSPGSNLGMFVASANGMVVNIGSVLFTILIILGAFLSTSYLIEKKIDL